MNKENIYKKASEILGLDLEKSRNDFDDMWELVENENCGIEDETLLTYALVAEYSFCFGVFDKWKEYQCKYNEAVMGGK